MTSTFDKYIAIGTDYLYVTRGTSVGGATINNCGRWNGSQGGMEPVSGGVNGLGLAVIAGPTNGEVYVAGTFTAAGSGGSVSVNRIAHYTPIGGWDDLDGASVFDANITSMAYDADNDLLYASSHQTSNTTNRIAVYNGTSWTGIAEGTVNTYTRLALDNSGNLYLAYGSTLKRRVGGSWETLSTGIGGTITDMKYNAVDDRMYIVLYISSGASIKYYDVEGESIESVTDLGGYPRGIAFDSNNNTFVARQSPSSYQETIVRLDGGDSGTWTNVYNHQATSGVLDIEIDANDNIYCMANAGSLTVGKSPYTNGNWASFSDATSTSDFGGPVNQPSTSPSETEYQVGDDICLSGYPTQHGIVYRKGPLGINKSIVVTWEDGPMFSQAEMTAFFGSSVDKIEHL